MEETNYYRAALPALAADEEVTPASLDLGQPHQSPSDLEKATREPSVANTDTADGQFQPGSNLSFLQKMKIFRRRDLERKVPWSGMLMRPFIFFSFPVVVFCGFMYGAIVCYFNVLNGTASLILSSPPYNFSASIVGLSYVSCLIGVFIG